MQQHEQGHALAQHVVGLAEGLPMIEAATFASAAASFAVEGLGMSRLADRARVRERMWAPDDPHLVMPQVFGVGWTVNLGRLLEPWAAEPPSAH